jgi:hypothetical protein
MSIPLWVSVAYSRGELSLYLILNVVEHEVTTSL